jgi:4-aminobutyrate aminotransferase
MSTAAEILALEDRFLSPATRIPFIPLVAESGSGAELVERDGSRLLDLHSMACTTSTGHCHPRVVEAIQRQAARLVQCNSGYAVHEPLVRLAAELVRITPGDWPKKVAFGRSSSCAPPPAARPSSRSSAPTTATPMGP